MIKTTNTNDTVAEEKYGFLHMFSDSRTREDQQWTLDALFARACQDEFHTSEEYYTPQEWVKIQSEDEKNRTRLGAKKFKRKALGFWRDSAIKSLDELAKDLFEVGVVDSLQEGKDLVPYLNGRRVNYGTTLNFGVFFATVLNKEGEKRYQVKAGL